MRILTFPSPSYHFSQHRLSHPAMPNSGSAGILIDGHDDGIETDEFEELDPSGRYGRYKHVLGRGAFKTVYKAFDMLEGIEVAWNQIKVHDVIQTQDDMERLYSEVHLLKTLKHRNIMKFYHSWIDPYTQNLTFLTELFTSGTLRQYCRRHRRIDIWAIKNWSKQILRGLLYLHGHDPPIIHRDLKCDNILINGNQGEVKIGDLGLAMILKQAHAARSVIGTPEFMAPELYEEEYTESVDIYSFGMCVLEMVTREYPYNECSNAAQIYKKVTAGKPPAALSRIKDPELRLFIEKCISPASRRLPARELLLDPFLNDCNHVGGPLSLPVLRNTRSADCFISPLDRTREKDSLASEKLRSMSCLSIESKQAPSSESGATKSTNEGPPSQIIEDKGGRKIDFQVKAKLREDNNLHLRLRIADPEGQVRVIHFQFDVETDTAISVAGEMISELNLSDQYVIRIAETIDAAIIAMPSDWKPGEGVCKGTRNEQNSTSGQEYTDCWAVTASSDQSESSSMAWISVPKDSATSPQVKHLMHGRFEEVHIGRDECSSATL